MTTEGVAIIGAAATVIAGFGGAALGAWFASKTGMKLVGETSKNNAISKLRASFAPALAKIDIAKFHGDTDLREFFDENIPTHAAAIEEFRPFVSDDTAYQAAWDNYKKTIYSDDALADADMRWLTGMVTYGEETGIENFLDVLKQKINGIIHFTLLKK